MQDVLCLSAMWGKGTRVYPLVVQEAQWKHALQLQDRTATSNLAYDEKGNKALAG